MAMSQANRNLLTRNRLHLIKGVILNQEFYAVLQSNHTLTTAMVEEIESANTGQGRVGKLLDILPKRGAEAFPTFIEALVETHQEHIVKLLVPSHVSSSGGFISQPRDSGPGVDRLMPSSTTSSATDRPSPAKSQGGGGGVYSGQQSGISSENPSLSRGPSQEQQPSGKQSAASKTPSVNVDVGSDVDEIIRRVYGSQNQSFIYDLCSPDDGDQPGKTESLRDGRCVIFRNNLPKKGAYEAKFDDINLIETFKKFGIKVENETAEDVLKRLKKASETETSAFFLFMFVSGFDDVIVTPAGERVSIVDIVEIFKRSVALRGKPKVLVFHVTGPQGPEESQWPHDKTDSIAEPAASVPLQELSHLSLNSSDDNLAVLKVDPSSGDLKIHWLVSSLIFLMTKYSKKYDLTTILERVKLILEKQGYEVTLSSCLKNGIYFTS